ncbi:uncharacterized protein LOC128993263 [Macrosteles quadrilineatus]|uniref:uncharacterized protein LOC128993263 n=1 Tax=Macrosteles quadrilineatus TaxID=74068 RepID=UPI0023E2BAE7|nr:uncharacterized protein LOC128993263 [Macrosteles quadrilineatus]
MKRGQPQNKSLKKLGNVLKRHKSDEDQEESQDGYKQIALGTQTILECPVCFEKMDSTLRQCMNGHGVCRPCASKIDKCPTCKEEFSLALHQNTLLNQLLDLIPKICPYAEEGCNSVIIDQEHQTYCEYRPTECKVMACKWSGRVKDLLEHLKSSHETGIINVNLNEKYSRFYSFHSFTTIETWSPILCQNQIFWKCFYHPKGHINHIYHRLYSVPTMKKSCDYYMVISFEKGDLKFEHYCKAANLDDQIEPENIEGGLIIPVNELNRFLVQGTQNKYDYKLKLVKENIS